MKKLLLVLLLLLPVHGAWADAFKEYVKLVNNVTISSIQYNDLYYQGIECDLSLQQGKTIKECHNFLENFLYYSGASEVHIKMYEMNFGENGLLLPDLLKITLNDENKKATVRKLTEIMIKETTIAKDNVNPAVDLYEKLSKKKF